MVFAAWFIVFNEDEDEYYLWERKRAYRPKITVRDLEAVLPSSVSILDMTPDQIRHYLPLIPEHKRVGRGVSWREVVSTKDTILQDQIRSIDEGSPTSSKASLQAGLQVKAVVGWSAYPGKKSYS